PVFGTFQGRDYWRWRLERIVRPHSLAYARGLIIAPAREQRRVTRSYRVRRIGSIPNPIDLATWRPRDRAAARASVEHPPEAGGGVVAGQGGVDVWKKGLDTLVDAWALVSEELGDDEIRLLLIGGGADEPVVRERIRERRLTNVVWVNRHVHANDRLAELLSA